MNRCRAFAIVAVLAAGSLFAGRDAEAAGPYSSVYVFGDSLSDVGRVAALTGGFPGPASGYAPGRFSNGAVAVETMTLRLTGAPLTLSTDYAHGGARTGVSPYSGGDNNTPQLNGTGVLAQTGLFRNDVGARRADPNALYVVFAGANDMTEAQVLTNQGGAQWDRVIGNVESAIGRLAADGARHFFVPNVPNLGLTPRAFASGAATAQATSRFVAGFNADFAGRLAAFDQADARVDITTFDVYGFLTDINRQVTSSGSFLGIANATAACQFNAACTDPDSYLFWDDIHPTARAHELLGEAFAAAVPEAQTVALLLLGLGVVGMAARKAERSPARR